MKHSLASMPPPPFDRESRPDRWQRRECRCCAPRPGSPRLHCTRYRRADRYRRRPRFQALHARPFLQQCASTEKWLRRQKPHDLRLVQHGGQEPSFREAVPILRKHRMIPNAIVHRAPQTSGTTDRTQAAPSAAAPAGPSRRLAVTRGPQQLLRRDRRLARRA